MDEEIKDSLDRIIGDLERYLGEDHTRNFNAQDLEVLKKIASKEIILLPEGGKVALEIFYGARPLSDQIFCAHTLGEIIKRGVE